MKTVDKPTFNAEDTFLSCISIVQNVALKAKLTACKGLIKQAESEFDSKVTTKDIHTIKIETVVNNNVTTKELEKVYTQRMAKKDVPGRIIYDKLFAAPKLGICPLCSHRQVETLDHYLPKAYYPRLATTPINLVPSCFTCNKTKLASSPNKPEDTLLHPYYDNIENEDWLLAKINKSNPPSVTYFVNPPAHWDDLLKNRLKYHFNSLYLNKLYSVQAAVLIRGLNFRLDSILKNTGVKGVEKYLKDEAESRYFEDKNSWQTAFYSAAYKDGWFCSGGFKI